MYLPCAPRYPQLSRPCPGRSLIGASTTSPGVMCSCRRRPSPIVVCCSSTTTEVRGALGADRVEVRLPRLTVLSVGETGRPGEQWFRNRATRAPHREGAGAHAQPAAADAPRSCHTHATTAPPVTACAGRGWPPWVAPTDSRAAPGRGCSRARHLVLRTRHVERRRPRWWLSGHAVHAAGRSTGGQPPLRVTEYSVT